MNRESNRIRQGSLLAALALALSAGHGHERAADGSDADWGLPGPTLSNMAHVVRDDQRHGTLVWRDGPGDAITAFNDPESEADLLEMRVAGSSTHLFLLLRFDDLVADSGPGTIQVQVAVDLDRAPGSGGTAFRGNAELAVNPQAGWEFLLATQWGSGSGQVLVAASGGSAVTAGQAAINPADDLVELAVPWQVLALTGPPASGVALSTAVFRAGADDVIDPVGDETQANALDVVTHNDQPGVAFDSSLELADGVLDHFLEVWFDAVGEVRSPLLIGAFQSRPSGMIAGESIRLVNASSVNLELEAFGVGDEETPGATEGMFTLPARSLDPGGQVVVARSAHAYTLSTGLTADFETEMSDPAVPSLAQDTAWAIGGLELVDGGDQVLLLDPRRTVIDAVAWGSAFYVGVQSLAQSGAGEFHLRAPTTRDRNLADDFRLRAADLSLQVTRLTARVVAGSGATYRIEVHNQGPDPAVDAIVRLDQFDGLAFDASECGTASVGAACQPLDAGSLAAAVTLNPGDGLEILVSATVQSGGSARLAAQVSPPDEVGELDPENNLDSDAQPIEPDLLLRDGYESS